MLSSDQIRVFLTIVDKGSFSAAGQTLRRSQTAISYAIRSLEGQLGLQLFERVGRRPVLTPAGLSLVADAQKVAHGIQNMKARAQALASGVESELPIAIDAYFPPSALIAPMRDFAEAFPQVHVTLRTEMIGTALERVADGACSLGIVSHVMGQRPDFQLVPIMMAPVHITPVAAANHPLSQSKTDVSTQQLAEHIQIVSELHLAMPQGILSPRLWHCTDLATQRAMLLSGVGWGGMPEHMVVDDIASGALRPLRIVSMSQPERTDIAMSVIHPVDALLGPAARWLIERLTLATSTPGHHSGA